MVSGYPTSTSLPWVDIYQQTPGFWGFTASALDLATTSYFLFFQDNKLPPMNTQYPDIERLSVGEYAQSASL